MLNFLFNELIWIFICGEYICTSFGIFFGYLDIIRKIRRFSLSDHCFYLNKDRIIHILEVLGLRFKT